MSDRDVVFAVDLDGTLVKSDLLHENLLATFSLGWKKILAIVPALLSGKAAIKSALSRNFATDVSRLPYRAEVLELIASARRDGRKVVLVSASDQTLVDRIASHLDCFDEAFGSDGSKNLAGRAKADFLVGRFGRRGFDYIGDAKVDVPVWQEARTALTVSAGAGLRRSVSAVSDDVRHIPPKSETRARDYLRALRPHQWIKNILVFLPLVASHHFTLPALIAAVAAFVAFSLTASSVYILNDLLDLEADRAHPRKRNRPFASGAVPIAHGVWMAVVLITSAILVAITSLPAEFLLVLAVYYVATVAYSFSLKKKMIVDICTLAGLYTLRVVGGGAAVSVVLSPWLLAFSMFLFLSLAALKRQAELIGKAETGASKLAGRNYLVSDLPVMTTMAFIAGYNAVLVFALYINSPAVVGAYANPALLWGICPILLYWIGRLVLLTHRGFMDDDPVVFAVKDTISLACGALTLAIAVAATVG
jgi:4-hydroxybenzoate polyprenyltransferase/phosphoserine phosphatase